MMGRGGGQAAGDRAAAGYRETFVHFVYVSSPLRRFESRIVWAVLGLSVD